MEVKPDYKKDSDGKSQANAETDIECGRKVLKEEAHALLKLNETLGSEFINALDLLFATKGRVIVSGMGKSGHVGRKIAATFASTGTPAFFIHPSEASHGDLGMIVEGDLILALSNSGESIELSDIVSHAKRSKIPLIIITSKKNSRLDQASDVSLIIPESTEACPHGLAPTTTTTAMLALGDAIAVALLERKKFSPSDFHLLHPGGKLGKKLLKVSDLMHKGTELPLVNTDIKMSEAIITMTAKHFGCLGVVNKYGNLQGVITDGDLRRHMHDHLLKKSAGEIMTTPFKTVSPDSLASEGLALMNNYAITHLFVVTNNKPIGILHVHDCLRAGIG